MYIYGMWPWKVPKWPWFWAEVAVKAWRDLATLHLGRYDRCRIFRVPQDTKAKGIFFSKT
jgi:hypothetical protein